MRQTRFTIYLTILTFFNTGFQAALAQNQADSLSISRYQKGQLLYHDNFQADQIIFIAHRGGITRDAPENSLLAFNHAIVSGAHAIEIDLRSTTDGEIVVMHDATVDRTTNGSGNVSDLTLRQLKKLDLGQGQHIPTYEEVLQLVSKTGVVLLLDIKDNSEIAKRKIVRLTEKYKLTLNVIMGVRSLHDLIFFRTLNPNFRILGFIKKVEDIELFIKNGVDIIRLWPKWIELDEGLIKRVHSMGKPVWVTAGDIHEKKLERLIKLGVDGALIDQLDLIKMGRDYRHK